MSSLMFQRKNKMAATSTSNTNPLTQRGIWPNRQCDYEIGEVIGKYML